MSLSDHPRVYGTAALATAFMAGVLLTLGFKDFYPDLERRFREYRQRDGHSSSARYSSFFFFGSPVQLEDREGRELAPAGSRAWLQAPPTPSPSSCALSSPMNGAPKPPPNGRAATPSPQTISESASSLPPFPPTGIVEGIEGCIGNTPLILIRSLSGATGRTILAKAEFLNGAGNSPKDRVALSLIRDAEARGLLVPGRGDTIYEGTVGSTGISLAALARARGHRAHICMPDDQAAEKADLLRALGAAVERVPVAPITSPDHYVNLARRRARDHTAAAANDLDTSRGFFADQFENPANWRAHARTTGPEIWAQTGGRIDAFVAGAGTGGTLAGVARHLKLDRGLGASLRVVLADPQGSGLYHRVRDGVMYAGSRYEREGGRRRSQVDSIVEGIGCTRVTGNFEAGRALVDDAERVPDERACRMARWLAERDGLFVGSSSAVNCAAAVAVAAEMPPGSVVVTVLCDSGARHLSKFWKRIGEMGLMGKDGEEEEEGEEGEEGGGEQAVDGGKEKGKEEGHEEKGGANLGTEDLFDYLGMEKPRR